MANPHSLCLFSCILPRPKHPTRLWAHLFTFPVCHPGVYIVLFSPIVPELVWWRQIEWWNEANSHNACLIDCLEGEATPPQTLTKMIAKWRALHFKVLVCPVACLGFVFVWCSCKVKNIPRLSSVECMKVKNIPRLSSAECMNGLRFPRVSFTK